MKSKTGIIIFLLFFLLSVPCIPNTWAAEKAFLVAESVSGDYHPGDEVKIKVSVSNLSYADNFVFKISYDPDFMIVKSDGVKFSPALPTALKNTMEAANGEVTVGYAAISSMSEGKLFDITFTIKAENGKKSSNVVLSDISFGFNGKTVVVVPVNGKVSIGGTNNEVVENIDDNYTNSNQSSSNTENKNGNGNSGMNNYTGGGSSSGSKVNDAPENGVVKDEKTDEMLQQEFKNISSDLRNSKSKPDSMKKALRNTSILSKKLMAINLGTETKENLKIYSNNLTDVLKSSISAVTRLGVNNMGTEEYSNLCSLLAASLKLSNAVEGGVSASQFEDSIKLIVTIGSTLEKETSNAEATLVLTEMTKELEKYVKDKKFIQQEKLIRNELAAIASKAVYKSGTATIDTLVKGKSGVASISGNLEKTIVKKAVDVTKAAATFGNLIKRTGQEVKLEKRILLNSRYKGTIDSFMLNISSDTLKSVFTSKADSIVISSQIASITVPQGSVIIKSKEQLALGMKKTSVASNIPKAQKAFVGKNPVYEFTFISRKNNAASSVKLQKPVKIVIPAKISKVKLQAYCLLKDGKIKKIGGYYDKALGGIVFNSSFEGKYVVK